MPYANRSEGKRPRTYPSGSQSEKLTDQALALAAQGEWAQAAKANRELLLSHPRDIRSLNRLGNCMTQLGDYKSATAAYSRTLEYDRQNEIALKNLGRLTLLTENTAVGAVAPVTTQHS